MKPRFGYMNRSIAHPTCGSPTSRPAKSAPLAARAPQSHRKRGMRIHLHWRSDPYPYGAGLPRPAGRSGHYSHRVCTARKGPGREVNAYGRKQGHLRRRHYQAGT